MPHDTRYIICQDKNADTKFSWHASQGAALNMAGNQEWMCPGKATNKRCSQGAAHVIPG